mmetsp:Transcript_124890/g.353496  ORF Transcript_124890/g.353496 Transcript_124890/m.353496 type:complete len:211 (+) Transcript_124890:105-737(+)
MSHGTAKNGLAMQQKREMGSRRASSAATSHRGQVLVRVDALGPEEGPLYDRLPAVRGRHVGHVLLLEPVRVRRREGHAVPLLHPVLPAGLQVLDTPVPVVADTAIQELPGARPVGVGAPGLLLKEAYCRRARRVLQRARGDVRARGLLDRPLAGGAEARLPYLRGGGVPPPRPVLLLDGVDDELACRDVHRGWRRARVRAPTKKPLFDSS